MTPTQQLVLAVADRVLILLALLVIGMGVHYALDIYSITHIPARPPRPPQDPERLLPMMTPAALSYVLSWPDGWEREQAEGALREVAVQLGGDWDKAVAQMPHLPEE